MKQIICMKWGEALLVGLRQPAVQHDRPQHHAAVHAVLPDR